MRKKTLVYFDAPMQLVLTNRTCATSKSTIRLVQHSGMKTQFTFSIGKFILNDNLKHLKIALR